MLATLTHLYDFAELYTVLLAWLVVPLGFFACYLFFQNHYGMFAPTDDSREGKGAGNGGT